MSENITMQYNKNAIEAKCINGGGGEKFFKKENNF